MRYDMVILNSPPATTCGNCNNKEEISILLEGNKYLLNYDYNYVLDKKATITPIKKLYLHLFVPEEIILCIIHT